ncbi:hypothetical protein KAW18_03875 [candidate division WOR-3 bacterium]|nr:hypothetical protein [candidate division WOR-3 bacterium]
MAKKGASSSILTFIKYEMSLITEIDKREDKKQKTSIQFRESCIFTTCSIIVSKRKQRKRK